MPLIYILWLNSKGCFSARRLIQRGNSEEVCGSADRGAVSALTQDLFLSFPAGAAVAGIYRVAGKNMAPLEALVWGVGQTVLTLIISFSRILATL